MTKTSVALLVLGSVGCGASGHEPVRAAHLPVSRVVMYQNGIGYFERRGRVDGEYLSLQARPTQINDMLKSLTVIDRKDGRAVSVSLPLEKTGAQLLGELPQQVQNAGGVLAVLQMFRGAHVAIEGKAGRISGRVLGVESVGSSSRVTVKTADDGLVVYPLDAVQRVTIQDRTLDVGLDKSLDVSLGEGQWKPVQLTVQLAGETPHDVVVSYITEMPLWKPAYRLVVSDENVLLQGWAVVDNVSGEDWRGVRLSLVAGAPMSFIYDLHSPKLVKRADLTPRGTSTALAPVIEAPGYAAAPQPSVAARPSKKARSSGGRAPAAPSAASKMDLGMLAEDYAPAAPEEPLSDDFDMGDALAQQVQARVEGTQVGALFRYDLEHPVDVPDRSSTLVSIANGTVTGREVVLLRPEQGGEPYRAVMFENGTGSTLEKGPVAIYSGGTFVGEGFLERLDPKAMAFVTYAADGRVQLKTHEDTGEEGLRLLRIQGGVIETQVRSFRRVTYGVTNRHGEAITAMVKTHERGGGWKLKDRPAGMVETPGALFIPIAVPAGEEAKLTLEWESPLVRRVAIDSDLSTEVLKLYLGSAQVPERLRKPLGDILSIKARLAAIANEERELNHQRQALSDDQQRVRQNLDLLRKTPGNRELQETLTAKLAELEGKLGTVSAKIVRYSEERAELVARMNVLIGQITLDEGK